LGLGDRRLDQLLGELGGDCMFLESLAHYKSLDGYGVGAFEPQRGR
jgi:hypothetical protein